MPIVKLAPEHCEIDGSLRVRLQDNAAFPVIQNMTNQLNTASLLTPPSINTRTVVLIPGHGAANGNLLCIREDTRVFQSFIINIATDTLTIDTPIDYVFSKMATVTINSNQMNVDGSTIPVIFKASPPEGISWDMYGIAFTITDGSTMDDAMFGGLTALTNGVVIRNKNGHFKTIANIKTNGQLAIVFKDFVYADKAPSGVFGIRAKHYINDANGTAMRLNEGDAIEVVIQDNLSGLSSFNAIAYGHEVI